MAVVSAAALVVFGVPAQAATVSPALQETADSASSTASSAAAAFQPVCGAPKPGTFSCFALRRTNDKQSLHAQASAIPVGYGPADLQSAYSLPPDGGSGQTVAIVDAFDDPTAESDLAVYRRQYGLPACTSANGCFSKVDQRGGTQYPPVNLAWAGEISLDLDMVSAIAPNAHILLVEADNDLESDLGVAVDEAVALGAKFVSNSYGGHEDPSETTFDAYYDHPGVAVVAASGDSGYGVAYPAASPYVTSVGGTSLTRALGTARGWSETAWSLGGSGCSAYEPKPAFQHDTGCANRVTTDVSAVADPNTGVAVYENGVGWRAYGGTSAASPIIAAVYADAGTPAAGTNPNSYPYAAHTGLNDIALGTNGGCTVGYLCNAVTGYDAPTGLGTPDGLQAFRTGPHGTLVGAVTGRPGGKPVVGAAVSDGTDLTHTDAQGRYTIALSAGRRDITVTAYGYATATARVNVAAGVTVRKNIALEQVPSASVSGTVADGSGQGWPLYAQVTVSGDPNSVWTDPRTGRYQLTLPQNTDYTLHFAPASPGYGEITKTVHVARAPLTVDATAIADLWKATTPGYQLTLTGPTEPFDSITSAPSGWGVAVAPNTTAGWEFDNPGNIGNRTGGSGGFAVADSNFYGFSSSFNTALYTPVFDLSSDTRPEVGFDSMWLDDPSVESLGIDASDDGWATSTTVWTPSPDTSGEFVQDVHIDVPLAAYAGKPSVQLRFDYASQGGYFWELDNVFVGQRDFAPAPGGLVVGVAHDANTGQGLADATVTDRTDPSVQAKTVATPLDPNLPDGYFSLFVPGAGRHVLTAAKFGYASTPQTVDVRAGRTVTADYRLDTGRLRVDPGSITAFVDLGGRTSRTLTVTNTGSAPATLQIGRQGGTSTPSSTAQGAPLQLIPGTYPAGRISGRPQTQSPAVAASAAPSEGAWQNAQNLPTALMDNVANAYNGKVYAGFGDAGLFGAPLGGDLYVMDPAAGIWTQLASAADTHQAPGHGIIGGKLYISGGWGADFSIDPKLEIYDIAGNTWTTGTPDPKPYAGVGSAVLGSKLYLVGGCGDIICGTTDVSVYDPATDTWGQTAPYPEPIAWPACAGIDGKLYCAGGTDNNTDNIRHAYVYDPAANAWSALPDMPVPLWGAAYAGANGVLVVSSGVTAGANGGALTNQVVAYDPRTGSWSTLPNANTPTYRGAGALGFYKLGGGINGITPSSVVENLPGYAVDPSVNVPWLAESATQLTLRPHQRVEITVTLDTSASQITQPGIYGAELVFGTNTPYPVPPVAVTLTVNPPGAHTTAARTAR